MGKDSPLCDSPYSLPPLLVVQLLGEVLRYMGIWQLTRITVQQHWIIQVFRIQL